MCNALRRHQISCQIWHNQILRQNVWTCRPFQRCVVIHLLEGTTAVSNIEQHLIKVRVILFHDLRDLVIHVRLYALRLCFTLRCHLSNDRRPRRAARWQQFLVRLRLELCHSLIQNRMGHAGRTFKRFRTLLKGQTEEDHPLFIDLLPLFAAAVVILNQVYQIQGNRLHDRLI